MFKSKFRSKTHTRFLRRHYIPAQTSDPAWSEIAAVFETCVCTCSYCTLPRLSRSCWQRLYQLAFVKAPWAISFEICFANWNSLDVKYWDFIFLSTIQSSQDLKTFVLLISLSNLTNWVLIVNVRQEIVHDDRWLEASCENSLQNVPKLFDQ